MQPTTPTKKLLFHEVINLIDKMHQYIIHNKKTIAIVIRGSFKPKGVEFISKEEEPLQIGVSEYNKNHSIPAHIHRPIKATIKSIQEVVYIEKGKVEIQFYSPNKKLIKKAILKKHDFCYFISGGHGFKMLSKSKIFEVKQGPYRGNKFDKEYIK